MIRTVALSAALLAAGGLLAQPPAMPTQPAAPKVQPKLQPAGPKARPTAPPAGKQKAGEPQKLSGTVELKPKPGTAKKAMTYGAAPVVGATPTGPGGTRATPYVTPGPFVPLPVVRYVLGVYGYDAGDGVVVMGPLTVRDLDRGGMPRTPALEILLDQTGTGQWVVGRLDNGDKIVTVDGYLTRNLAELGTAVQQAPDKSSVDAEVVDYFTQQVVRVKVRAARMY